jgi:hypothetical protein
MAKSTSWLVTTFAVASCCALWTTSATQGPTATAIVKSQRQIQLQKTRRQHNPAFVGSQLLLKDLRGGSDRGYGYNNYGDTGAAAADDGDDDNEDAAYYRRSERDDYYTERLSGRSTGGYRDDDYDEADRDYYDGKRSSQSGRRSKNSSGSSSGSKKLLQSLPNIIQNGDRRIGLLLLGSGTVVTMMGITLFFQRTLMRLGNLLVIAGIPMTIGPQRCVGYFMDPQKTRASVCLAAGIFLVLVAGRPVFGIALELFGLLNLFGNMFPVVLAIAKQMPVIGPLLSGSSKNGSSNNNNSRRSNNNNNYSRERQRSDNDYYYEGGRDGDGRDQQGGDYYGYDDRPGDDANADRFY